jgi:type I pantothenate kinase
MILSLKKRDSQEMQQQCKTEFSLTALAEIISLQEKKQACHELMIVGITGASGAGKTTFSLALQKNLKETLPEKRITVIPADNFIYSNAYLDAHNLMKRKGFPESFNAKELKNCLENLTNHQIFPFNMPCYSQDIKDIMPGKVIPIEKSDIYIIEGVNLFFKYDDFHAVDYLDFSIYLDTESDIVKERAIKRFMDAYAQSKEKPTPYFEQFAGWTQEAIRAHAEKLWQTMDSELFKNYIEPHRSIANLILKSYT